MPIPPEVIASSMSMLASVLSMASSIKNIMTGRKVDSKTAIGIFKQTASPEEIGILADADVENSISEVSNVIAADLLGQLASEAKRCQDRHINDRQAALTQMSTDQADINAALCMCSVLRDIRRYNKGVLPSGPFKNWWESYSCPE
jgi:hypothetical protein